MTPPDADQGSRAAGGLNIAVSPLPVRRGVSASTMVLPPLEQLNFQPASVLAYLEHPTRNPQRIDWISRFHSGLICDAQGQPLAANEPYMPGLRIHYWRDAGFEQPIPFTEKIIYQDKHLLVVDKPHFLPVTPTGRYVQESLLVRLKNSTGLASLTPIHRIDRDTAGLVMFCVRMQDRNAYAQLFRERGVRKRYDCIAAFSHSAVGPIVRRSRLVPSPDCFMQMREVSGEPNTETRIQLIERLDGSLARYQLEPITGKRHQLRVHMCAMGLPMLGDGIYPQLAPARAPGDYDNPLRLLAKELAFQDPVSGLTHHFFSVQSLD